jgi:hypothetical protein
MQLMQMIIKYSLTENFSYQSRNDRKICQARNSIIVMRKVSLYLKLRVNYGLLKNSEIIHAIREIQQKLKCSHENNIQEK